MLLAPRRDTPEGDQSLSSGLREEAQETDDEMGGVAAALVSEGCNKRKKGASRVAPLALVEHVVKLDFQALPFLIGCERESLQRNADFSSK